MNDNELKLYQSAMAVIARFYEPEMNAKQSAAPEMFEAIRALDKACLPYKSEYRNNTLYLIAKAGINPRMEVKK